MKLNELMSKDPMALNIGDIQKFLQTRMRTPCAEVKPFGGKYLGFCKISDGHKYVCVDNLLEHIEKKKVGTNPQWSS